MTGLSLFCCISKCQKKYVGYRMSGASTAVRIEFQPIWPLAVGARNLSRKREDLETPERIFILFSFGPHTEQVIN